MAILGLARTGTPPPLTRIDSPINSNPAQEEPACSIS